MRVRFCKGLAFEKPGAEFNRRRSAQVKIGGIVLLAVMSSACSTTFEDQVGSLYVAPGKFVLLKCPDIAAKSIADSNREKELVSLMDRANQDVAGPVINTLIYQTDLSTVRAELAELKKMAQEKNCDNVVAAKTPASVPRSDLKPAR